MDLGLIQGLGRETESTWAVTSKQYEFTCNLQKPGVDVPEL